MEVDERKGRRTAAQWQQLLERQAQSGQSVEAFCRARAISPASFYRWRRRLSGEPAAVVAAAKGAAAAPAFVDLGALGAGRGGWELEIALGGAVVLRLRGG
jgi:Transposase